MSCSATCSGASLDPYADPLGEPDTVSVDVDLDNFGLSQANSRRHSLGRVEKGLSRVPRRENDIGFGHQFHSGLGAVVAEGATGEGVAAGEGVVVLVIAADRGTQFLGECLGGGDAVSQGSHPAPFNMTGKLSVGEKRGRIGESPAVHAEPVARNRTI